MRYLHIIPALLLAVPVFGQGAPNRFPEAQDYTPTGAWDFSSGTCRFPQAATCAATDCDEAAEDGRGCYDTDATSGQRWLMCEFGSGWVAQGAAAFTPTAGISTDHGAGAIVATTDFAAGLCGTNEILEDQGPSWACIAAPSSTAISAGDSSVAMTDTGSDGTATVTADGGVVGLFTSGGLQLGSAATTDQLLLPQQDDAVTPTLAFGDGDTGVYEWFDDQVFFAHVGAWTWGLTATDFYAANTVGPVLKNVSAAATTPTFLPNRGDNDTGIGSNGLDQLSFIAGGWEGIRITEAATDSVTINGITYLETVNGSLYETDDAASNSITVATEGTYVGWTTATAGPLNGGMTADVADATADHLTVPVAGDYHCPWSLSFQGSVNDHWIVGISKNETITACRHHRTITSATSSGSAGGPGCHLTLVANDRIGLMVDCTDASPNCNGDSITIFRASLYCERVGS